MNDILEINGLCKKYQSFTLSDIDISLPEGCIMGFMGENGSGKTTTIKAVLGLIKTDAGSIRLFGRPMDRKSLDDVGFVLDSCPFPELMNAVQVGKMMSSFYSRWDGELYKAYLKKFSVDAKKDVGKLSQGNKTKLSIAAALSHHPRLLILDEPTNGLDPVARDLFLGILMDFIQDEKNSVFMSSHITGDLEKICDYIAFIYNGKIKLTGQKDQILERYGILHCGKEAFKSIDPSAVYANRTNRFGVDALVNRKRLRGDYTVDPATLEEIMLFTINGQETEL